MYDNVCVGLVVNKDGNLSTDQALAAWNAAQPNYAGDSAESSPFIEV